MSFTRRAFLAGALVGVTAAIARPAAAQRPTIVVYRDPT
jgi:hypothetical protein